MASATASVFNLPRSFNEHTWRERLYTEAQTTTWIPAPAYEQTVTHTETYETTARVLNIRRAPNTSSDVLGVLYKGNQVEVIEFAGDFAKI